MDQTQKRFFLLFSDSEFSPTRGMKVTKMYTVFQLNQSHWITKDVKKKGTKKTCEN